MAQGSRLPAPPTRFAITVYEGMLNRPWMNWFTTLYSVLGGQSNLGQYFITAYMNDVHTAQTVWVPVPANGVITNVTCTLQGTISTLEEFVTVNDAHGNNMGIIELPVASGPGFTTAISPNSSNVMAAGSPMSLVTQGFSSAVCAANFVITISFTGG